MINNKHMNYPQNIKRKKNSKTLVQKSVAERYFHSLTEYTLIRFEKTS